MKELLFMEPFFKEVLWGGDKMKKMYGYDIPGADTGEAWVVSANAHGQSKVKGGTYDGQTLGQVFDAHPELFGNLDTKVFPLLTKVIDANDDLSVQVHPGDAYAAKNENGSKGKTECWYVLDCEPDAQIVLGHEAQTKEELVQMIEQGKWDSLLHKFPIKKGDFFYTPSGVVHAICKGTVILETQQNSDVTYRLYDYDRLQNGQPRELHIQKSEDVITCPQSVESTVGPVVQKDGYTVQQLVAAQYFTVDQYVIDSHAVLSQDEPFLIVDVIGGSGTVDGTPIQAGDHFIIPAGYGPATFDGQLELITSHI